MLNKKKSALIGIIVSIFLIIFAGLAYIVMTDSSKGSITTLIKEGSNLSITEQLQDNNREIIEITDEKLSKQLAELKSEPVTIAFYGSDARSSEASRSDVIMLMKLYPMTNEAVLISVPRDTRVDIPGKKTDKINHAFAFGGPQLLTKTLEKLFNTKIDYYLKFNFADFAKIIDLLDGVSVNADKDYGYDQTVVPKGISTLTGKQALFYVRFRRDANGDFGRIRRQQEVIVSLSEKIYTTDSSELKQDLTEIYLNYLKTNFELSRLLNYQQVFNSSEPIKFERHMLKTKGKIIDKIYYGIADKDSLETLRTRLKQ